MKRGHSGFGHCISVVKMKKSTHATTRASGSLTKKTLPRIGGRLCLDCFGVEEGVAGCVYPYAYWNDDHDA
jgi:hypothetical protein